MNDLKVLIQREKIAERVGQLGADITRDFAGWGLKAECGVAQPRKFDAFKIHDLTVQLPFCRSPFIASTRPPPVEQVPAAAVVSPVASCGVLTG